VDIWCICGRGQRGWDPGEDFGAVTASRSFHWLDGCDQVYTAPRSSVGCTASVPSEPWLAPRRDTAAACQRSNARGTCGRPNRRPRSFDATTTRDSRVSSVVSGIRHWRMNDVLTAGRRTARRVELLLRGARTSTRVRFGRTPWVAGCGTRCGMDAGSMRSSSSATPQTTVGRSARWNILRVWTKVCWGNLYEGLQIRELLEVVAPQLDMVDRSLARVTLDVAV